MTLNYDSGDTSQSIFSDFFGVYDFLTIEPPFCCASDYAPRDGQSQFDSHTRFWPCQSCYRPGNCARSCCLRDCPPCAQKTKDLLDKVLLCDKAKAFPKTLSGGEASRVAFARAFIAPPEVLLLDEPFRAVDTITKEGLQDLLIQFADLPNTTIVLVSHSIDDAVFLSDRVIALAGSPPRATTPGSPLHILEEFPVALRRPRKRDDKYIFELAQKVKAKLRAA